VSAGAAAAKVAGPGPVFDVARSRRPQPVRAWIGGRWVEAEGARTFSVRCPSSGASLAEVPACGRAETAAAIVAASDSLADWSALAVDGRGAVLSRAAALLHERRQQLGRLIALEAGKPLVEAIGEVGYAAGFLEFFAEEAARLPASERRPSVAGKRVYTLSRPVGVAGLITIWNFPAAGVTRPLGAALAAGCTAVLKPAEQTPLSAVAIFAALEEAGLPAGVANLVAAEDPVPIADELVRSTSVRKLSFTGSGAVGKRLLASGAAQLKRVTLELGGSAPFIVFADADLEAATEGAVRSKFRNAGQTCVCANRLYVQRAAADEFTKRFAARVRELRVGDPLDERTDIGPLVDDAAAARVEEHVADALAKGATLVTGGERARPAGTNGGHYFNPTILSGATEAMRVMQEETFGPVAPIATFESEAEAIAAANRLPWGLAAFCYTSDEGRASRLAERLDYGVVGVNDPLPAAPSLPFGGVKESGIGKEGGPEGLREYLETRLVSVGQA
jgi:succinate-semialdehyde dehydrogenase/glutarate-semialdehyde dehydrogenase